MASACVRPTRIQFLSTNPYLLEYNMDMRKYTHKNTYTQTHTHTLGIQLLSDSEIPLLSIHPKGSESLLTNLYHCSTIDSCFRKNSLHLYKKGKYYAVIKEIKEKKIERRKEKNSRARFLCVLYICTHILEIYSQRNFQFSDLD